MLPHWSARWWGLRWCDTIAVHAFKDREQAEHQASEHICDWIVVVGSVTMWGEVIEHQHGWRSEYAAVWSITKIKGNRNFSSKQQLRQLLFDLRKVRLHASDRTMSAVLF
jgi:hypothetical protein